MHFTKGIRELDCERTSRAGTKVGLSDPVVPSGRAIGAVLLGLVSMVIPIVAVVGKLTHK
jgi:hypothetical protein